MPSALAGSSRCASPQAESGESSSVTFFVAWSLVRWPSSSPLPSTEPPGHTSTRAGTEALAHSLQLECDLDPSLSVLSVDGVGWRILYDLIRSVVRTGPKPFMQA